MNNIKGIFFPDYIWKFQRLLRKTEYTKNCKSGILGKIQYVFLQYHFQKLSLKLGFSIPLNVFGPGLAIVHYGTIVVNANAKVGANCRIHPSTCIGASGGSDKAPRLGDNVYIGPGVKIYGDIVIGNNIAMAANSAVNKSFPEENSLIGGVPAKRIKAIDISSIIKHIGDE
ncbi:serine O-acetyltransferase [Microbacter margulisiae]|uniref:Serine O-acetyltransferase n=1 Tax=Microbacter margulisiae TaxID=1350067 RepID=A0A7W5H143_9PORP|nr:serine acetyltransferase [Microbacter margulisiae]MBB3185987.1 serine O-acetyltransferase [Microbacter margulisiae]